MEALRRSRGSSSPGAAEIGAYRLSMATLHKIEQTIKNLAAMAAANPSVVERLDQLQLTDPKDGSPLTLDKAVAQVGSVPEFKKALAAAGWTPREYVVFGLALVGASFAQLAVFRDGNLPGERPPCWPRT